MTTSQFPIVLDAERIAEFCRARGIRKLSLFGSVLRDDFTPESDVDVLVEFLPEARPGLDYFGYGDELTDIVGRKIDLCSKLDPLIRDTVEREAVTIYEQA
ncbi:MAG: nucleotidyltransferase family protein [Verrucomicrobiota bacterium]|nr:nucleotidyltransferase family protein [Verrucomicrobiota bacterium]